MKKKNLHDVRVEGSGFGHIIGRTDVAKIMINKLYDDITDINLFWDELSGEDQMMLRKTTRLIQSICDKKLYAS